MTDWFGVANTASSLGAGLDLEMPGPGRALGADGGRGGRGRRGRRGRPRRRGPTAAARSSTGIGALDDAPSRGATPVDRPRTVALAPASRRPTHGAAGATTARCRSIAASIRTGRRHRPERRRSPASWVAARRRSSRTADRQPARRAARRASATAVEIVTSGAARSSKSHRGRRRAGARAPDGFEVERVRRPRTRRRRRRATAPRRAPHAWSSRVAGDGRGRGDWSVRVRGTVVPTENGVFELRARAGRARARVSLDGELVLDGFTDPPPPGGTEFFGHGERGARGRGRARARASRSRSSVEYATSTTTLAGLSRRVPARRTPTTCSTGRSRPPRPPTSPSSSSAPTTTGRPRAATARRFDLPGDQDELVRRVAAANPRTVVVVNAGAPVDLPWADDVAAVLQCWFGGQEMADALADVLVGEAEPGGRLPTTIPVRLEHNPSYGNFPGENGEVRYGEGVFMGYRGYEHRRRRAAVPVRARTRATRRSRSASRSLSADTFRPGDRSPCPCP